MKKLLREKVEHYFDKLIEERFTEFIRIHPTSMFYSNGEFLYERKSNASAVFILIEEHPKGEDLFRILVGWSKLGRPPELSFRPRDFELLSNSLYDLEEFFCSLLSLAEVKANFWKVDTIIDEAKLKKDTWLVETVGISKSGPSPCDLLLRNGIPFLEKWIEHDKTQTSSRRPS